HFQGDAQRVLDEFVHVDVLREGLADEAGGFELALALDQAAVQLPTRRAAAVRGVPWVGRKWPPVTRHVRLIASFAPHRTAHSLAVVTLRALYHGVLGLECELS